MAIDPSFALQVALVSLLKADSGVQALLGTPARVWDQPPASPTFPYVTVFEADVHGHAANLGEVSETYATLHIWSRGQAGPAGSVEAKKIADAVRTALTLNALAPTGHKLVTQRVERVRVMRDPDGLTTHGVLILCVVTAPLNS